MQISEFRWILLIDFFKREFNIMELIPAVKSNYLSTSFI